VSVYNLTSPGAAIANAKTDASGRALVDLIGDISDSNETVFAGNYLLNVTYVAGSSQYFREVALAAREDTQFNVQIPEKVIPPFSISLKTRTEPMGDLLPGSKFYVRGEIFYNGGPQMVSGAQISIVFLEDGRTIYNATADKQGIFSVELESPTFEGTYSIEVHAYDPVTGYTNSTMLTISVKQPSLLVYAPWVFVIIVVILVLIFYAIMRVRSYRTDKMKKASRKLAFDEVLLKELEKEVGAKKAEEKKTADKKGAKPRKGG
jgi:hypothetical protein